MRFSQAPPTIPAMYWLPLYAIASLGCLATPVSAWGREGHEIVANIAYRRLSSHAKDAVRSILQLDDDANNVHSDTNNNIGEAEKKKNHTDQLDDTPLAHVANWADKVRFTSQYRWSTPLHFVDVRDDVIKGGCPCTTTADAADTFNAPAGDDGAYCTAISASSCWFDYERDCTDDFCAVGAIANYTSRLKAFHHHSPGGHTIKSSPSSLLRGTRVTAHSNQNDNAWPAKEALMFLTHFVGDIHQPLHASRGSDRGGNSIHVYVDQSLPLLQPTHRHGTDDANRDKSTLNKRTGLPHKQWNLHSIWDDGIIDRAISDIYNSSQLAFEQSVIDLLDEVQSSGLVDVWLRCSDGLSIQCPSTWAEESFEDALRWAYSDEGGREVVDGMVLSVEYFDTRLHVVRRRLAAAGVRLAAVLEGVLGADDGTSRVKSSSGGWVALLVGMQKPTLFLSST